MFNLHKYSDAAAKPPKHPSGPQKGSGPGGQDSPFGRKRIKDRGIKWEERYGEKSKDLKKKFDKDLGPGSYMRWEGHDYTTNGDYFVVVGPAVTQDEKKQFFAGIKRLPDDPNKKVYSPSGEYFNNIHAAYSHASEKWGIKYPQDVPQYTTSDLANIKIPRHVKA